MIETESSEYFLRCRHRPDLVVLDDTNVVGVIGILVSSSVELGDEGRGEDCTLAGDLADERDEGIDAQVAETTHVRERLDAGVEVDGCQAT